LYGILLTYKYPEKVHVSPAVIFSKRALLERATTVLVDPVCLYNLMPCSVLSDIVQYDPYADQPLFTL
jgi:hypothetical protein